MSQCEHRVFSDLILAQALLHVSSTLSAHDEEVTTDVLAECAAAYDAVTRALAHYVADRGIPPDDLQPLADETLQRLFGPDSTS